MATKNTQERKPLREVYEEKELAEIYETANKLYAAYAEQLEPFKDKLQEERNLPKGALKPTVKYLFGHIINTPNKNGETLVSVFGEDKAVAITNLVLRDAVQPRFETLTVDY